MPSSLPPPSALTARPRRPGRVRGRRRLGAARRARRPPPPAAPRRRRLAAVLRRQVPQHDQTPALSPANTRDGLLRQMHEERHVGLPGAPIPLAQAEMPADAAELAVTWFGHASALLEVDGQRVLVDPVWGYRVSPSPVFGPTRLHPPPMPLERAPAGRRHRHLPRPLRPPRPADRRALLRHAGRAVRRPARASAQHLRKWGVPEERIVELDWDGSTTVGGLALTCTEARHFSGRYFHRDTTLWASWAIAGPAAPGLLRRRHRLHPGVRRDRRPARALRPHPAADRRLQRRLARDPHGPGGGRAGARRPRRPGAAAHPLGHLQPGLPPLGGAGAAAAGRRRARPARRSSSPGPASGSTCSPAPLGRLVDGGRLGRPTRTVTPARAPGPRADASRSC